METGVYVDVLLVINYVISAALLSCSARLSGRKPTGRRIVGASLIGSVSSLTIFLPLPGYFISVALKAAISAGMVFAAFRWISLKSFLHEWFVFFSVNFMFAGVMLALWAALKPSGMQYYNGVVYFDISSFTLLVSTIIAYSALTAFHRITRSGRVKADYCTVTLRYGARSVVMKGLVDTGNSLSEPFSGAPVIVCGLESVAPLLSYAAVRAIAEGEYLSGKDFGIPFRAIPYGDVSGSGILPAFRPDSAEIAWDGEIRITEYLFAAISPKPVGDDKYDAVLSPDLAGAVKPIQKGMTSK